MEDRGGGRPTRARGARRNALRRHPECPVTPAAIGGFDTALSHITENRKVEAPKSLIFQAPIFGFRLPKALLRQSCHATQGHRESCQCRPRGRNVPGSLLSSLRMCGAATPSLSQRGDTPAVTVTYESALN